MAEDRANIKANIKTITKTKTKTIRPFLYQLAAISDAVSELKSTDRATVVMPCGTGKTLVCLWIAEKSKAKSVVIFIPSLALIHQFALEWARASSNPLNIVAICSDKTVALDEDGIIVEKDEFWFPVLIKKDEIQAFLRQKQDQRSKIVFCTYQSSLILSEALKNIKGFQFDLGVCDEAHRTAVKGISYFSAPLFDEYIGIKKRLFVTATPKQFSFDQRDAQDDFIPLLSMDDVDSYGRHCHVLSFRKAIEQGIISDYKIIFPEVTSEMVLKEMKNHGEDSDLTTNVAYNAAMQIALKKALLKTGAAKIVSFHTQVSDAKQFSNSLIKSRTLSKHKIFHVNGKQASSTRKSIMNSFETSSNSLITNARCLTEGIDAPSFDMIAIFSNKKSKIDIIQGIGRALRKHPGKKYGYILVPVFIDTAANETLEDALSKPSARVLFEVLLALEQHDELLCEAIKRLKFNEGYTGDKEVGLLNQFFDTAAQKYLASTQFTKALSIAIIDRLGSNWDKMVAIWLSLKIVCNVPRRFNNQALANWVSNLRRSYKKGKLTQDKIARLEDLGFILPKNQ